VVLLGVGTCFIVGRREDDMPFDFSSITTVDLKIVGVALKSELGESEINFRGESARRVCRKLSPVLYEVQSGIGAKCSLRMIIRFSDRSDLTINLYGGGGMSLWEIVGVTSSVRKVEPGLVELIKAQTSSN
jgi:hypothetical protein